MPKKRRPAVLVGKTFKIPTSCGNLFLRVNKDDTGDIIEVFGSMGKGGNCSNAFLEAISYVCSEAFKFEGMTKEEKIDMIDQIVNIRCPQGFKSRDREFKSCIDEMGVKILEELKEEHKQS